MTNRPCFTPPPPLVVLEGAQPYLLNGTHRKKTAKNCQKNNAALQHVRL